MTTTVRSVRVELEAAVAGYIRDITLAGDVTDRAFSGIEAKVGKTDAAIGGLEKSTAGLSKTSTQAKTSQSGLGAEVAKTGSSASRAERSIDKYSGRLKLLTDLALIGGPALLRLGAGSLPAVSAGLAGIGALGGGIGVTALAVSGLGDALKALDEYQADQTAENLQKARVELEKLGPAGADFVHYLDQIEPDIKGLQLLARAGIFPGFEDGIDSLLTRLPVVRSIVRSLSQEVGDLAADAGGAIASDKLGPFLKYIRDEGAPTLDDFARSAGNVALGVANLLVAFAPLSSDFTGGLEDATKAFADWSAGLDDDQAFQGFLSYVRESGPEAVDFLVSLVKALAGLAQAAAPLGSVLLPALTAVANVFGTIASSPIGPGLYTAAAGLVAFNRAASITSKSSERLQTSWSKLSRGQVVSGAAGGLGLLALSLTDVDEQAGLANTSMDALAGLMVGGPWGAAAGAAIGQYQDLSDATAEWTANVKKADEALRSGDRAELSDQLANIQEQYDKLLDKVPDSKLGIAKTLLSGTKWMAENDAMNAYADRIAELEIALKEGGDAGDLFGETIGLTGDQLSNAAGDATAFSGALAALNGWFDKRDAVRAYKDSIDSLRESLEDGFSREDAANVDAIGRSILQVATNIKNPGKRATFLDNARDQLADMAQHSGPKAAAALQEIIDKFDDKGLTHPKITPEVDDSRSIPAADRIKNHVKGQFDIMDGLSSAPKVTPDDTKVQSVAKQTQATFWRIDALRANPFVTVNPGNSLGIVAQIRNALNSLHDRTLTVTVNQRGGVTSSAGGHSSAAPGEHAAGGYIDGPGTSTSDSIPARLSKGEYVVKASAVTQYGVGFMDALNRQRFADGGLVGSTYTRRTRSQDYTSESAAEAANAFHVAADAASGAAGGLKKLEAQLDKVQRSYDKEKSKLDALTSSRDSLASSISSSAQHDPFGNGLAGLDAQLDADIGDIGAMGKALAQLVTNGLDPKSALYQALAASMDVNTAQQLAQLSAGDLATRAQRFQQRSVEADALGSTVANQEYLEAIRDQTRTTKRLDHRLEQLADAIKDLKRLPDHVKQGAKDGSREGSEAGAYTGTKAGQGDRGHRVTAGYRTGVGS